MAKIGAILDKLTTSLDTSKASEDAAVAANAKATADKETVTVDKKRFATALTTLGGLAVPRPDGKTEAYYPSTTMPDGYYSEFLVGPDADVPDDNPPVETGPETTTGTTTEGSTGTENGAGTGNNPPDQPAPTEPGTVVIG